MGKMTSEQQKTAARAAARDTAPIDKLRTIFEQAAEAASVAERSYLDQKAECLALYEKAGDTPEWAKMEDAAATLKASFDALEATRAKADEAFHAAWALQAAI